MKTIVLGFSDQKSGEGLGQASVVSGPEIPAHEQEAIVKAARETGSLPPGIQLLAMCVWESRIVAIAAEKTIAPTVAKTTEPKKSKKQSP